MTARGGGAERGSGETGNGDGGRGKGMPPPHNGGS